MFSTVLPYFAFQVMLSWQLSATLLRQFSVFVALAAAACQCRLCKHKRIVGRLMGWGGEKDLCAQVEDKAHAAEGFVPSWLTNHRANAQFKSITVVLLQLGSEALTSSQSVPAAGDCFWNSWAG